MKCSETADRIIGICERNQHGALVLDLGGLVLARRFGLRRFKTAAERAAFMADRAQELAVDYNVNRIAVERQGELVGYLRVLRLQPEELSLAEVKKRVLSVDVPKRNQNLIETVAEIRPNLRRFALAGRDRPVFTTGEPDRWRTVVLMAGAFALAAKRQTTSSN